jgi:hypothetical protein
MANNVRLKSHRQNSVHDIVKKTSPGSKPSASHSPRELRKEARDNANKMERLEMLVAGNVDAQAARSAPVRLRRRPHHRRELERRRSAALIMQSIIMFVVLAAAVGWLNQRFHFWGQQ